MAYWILAFFNGFVALSAVATVLGQSPEAYSEPVVLVCATIIAVAALFCLVASVWLAVRHRTTKQGRKGLERIFVAEPAEERRELNS